MRYFYPGFTIHPPILVSWNPADKDANITLSSGNLVATNAAAGDAGVRGTFFRAVGKWYFEITFNTITGGDTGGGLSNGTATFAALAGSASGGLIQFKSGNMYKNGTVQFNNGAIAAGGIMRVAYDADNHLTWLAQAGGNWNNNAANDPATATGGLASAAYDTGGLFPAYIAGANADAATGNFGASSFTYSIPSGFLAWNG